MHSLLRIAVAAAAVGCASPAASAVVFSGAGASTGTTVDAFRNALGALNPNMAGSFGGGRREINWDGVPDALSAPNNLPADFFNVNSPRGAVFATPGTGFQVSANAGAIVPVEFGNIDPNYSQTFATFSPQRLFTALGSNIVDVNFFVPGSTDAALVRGFGSVFSDVDLAAVTSIQFFGAGNEDLGTFFAPNLAGANETLSFLGVDFGAPLISRVRITNGTSPLAPGLLDGGSVDLVVMDDFIYGEPLLASGVIPEPASWALMIAGFGLTGWAVRRRRAYA